MHLDMHIGTGSARAQLVDVQNVGIIAREDADSLAGVGGQFMIQQLVGRCVENAYGASNSQAATARPAKASIQAACSNAAAAIPIRAAMLDATSGM